MGGPFSSLIATTLCVPHLLLPPALWPFNPELLSSRTLPLSCTVPTKMFATVFSAVLLASLAVRGALAADSDLTINSPSITEVRPLLASFWRLYIYERPCNVVWKD